MHASPCFSAAAGAALLVLLPAPVRAQAFTPPQGVGAVTVASQIVDNTGHRLSDGFLVSRGESITTSLLIEVEYGITDRLSATLGTPYVFAKYTGALPPPSNLPVDSCQCWHSSFQDLSFSARYRFGDERWAVTPLAKFGAPTHNYPYRGEAVVGRNLNELQVGVGVGLKLMDILPKASILGGYTYAFVERALDDVKIDRSNAYISVGYALKRSLFVHGGGLWQRTHGGLRAGSVTGTPFPFPGELNTPERFQERDRLLRTNYWHLSGGVSYSTGPVDFFGAMTKYMGGTDTHNGQAYTFGATWYFDLQL